MDLLASITFVALLAWAVLGVWWWLGMRRLPELSASTSPAGVADDTPAGGWPSVALIVAARDESVGIRPALRSWLAQDYPDLEVVVLDDRSSDGTGAQVESALAEHLALTGGGGGPRARLVRLESLPGGWLGKTHAQAHGASLTASEWLLFVDADVRLAPCALREAVRLALGERCDHLAVIPRFDAPSGAAGHLVLAFETAFVLLLSVLVRPWLAPRADSEATLGIGAFGLYRRDTYERAGGHESVRLRPDDDLALARSVKAAGGRSLAAFAPELVAVTWYATLREALLGLRKNAFAGLDFSLVRVALVSVGLLTTHVMPFVVALVGSGPERSAGVGVVLIVTAVYAWFGRRVAQPAWYALLHPLSVSALVAALLGSTFSALRTGRIDWRGTRYSLAELRRARRGGASDHDRNRPRT